MQLRNESLNSPHYTRKVWLTRLGLHFLFVSAFAMLGGALRGFNLLLVVAGLLVGALFIQWRWSRGTVMALSLRRRLPSDAYVGKPFAVDVEVTNHSRWMTMWLLRVEDSVESQSFSAKRQSDDETPLATIRQIAPLSSVSRTTYFVPQSRGTLTLGPLRVISSFPLDLLTARVTDSQQATVDVYPKLLSLNRGWQRVVAGRNDGVTGATDRTGPSEGEFYGLRPYRDGDTVRKIHWRTSARLDYPVVAQYEQSRRYELCVIVDAFLESPSANDALVERSISAAATVVLQLAGSNASRIVVAAAGQEAMATLASGSPDNKRNVLSLLARVRLSQSPDLLGAFEQSASLSGRSQDVVVLSPRSMQQAIDGLDPDLHKRLENWLRRGRLRWLDLSSPAGSHWFEIIE
ncbi:membrane protein containing DUF58 [Rhodopirellula maiorica SM1]|uniref:Membrane protein containing DUF58 n=1 Tax=Rhodopirellula maiorica SM1 TaxID=1265738 RepID=M5RJV2_9BACT|nr:DUF58 domain-containing protein [Rhodopirellula maiorica]EMI19466.1 membrane protein containing DUF58 [Rhodopirellula maiorica SM1]